MKQSSKIILAVVIILSIIVLVLGVDWARRSAGRLAAPGSTTATPLPAGSVPIYLNGSLVGGFMPGDLDKLQKITFTDTAENRPQDGWLLKEILLLHIPADQLKPETKIVVTSSSRNKWVELGWAEVENPANLVMFDLSNRGTLKLVSLLSKLDEREEWIQDADKIEVSNP
jgi:hypothetical protein